MSSQPLGSTSKATLTFNAHTGQRLIIMARTEQMEWHQIPGNHVFDVIDPIPLQALPRAWSPLLRCHQPPVVLYCISTICITLLLQLHLVSTLITVSFLFACSPVSAVLFHSLPFSHPTSSSFHLLSLFFLLPLSTPPSSISLQCLRCPRGLCSCPQ